MMTNSDLGRLLKAFEIQSVLRAPMYVKLNKNKNNYFSYIISLFLANVKLVVKSRRIHWRTSAYWLVSIHMQLYKNVKHF